MARMDVEHDQVVWARAFWHPSSFRWSPRGVLFERLSLRCVPVLVAHSVRRHHRCDPLHRRADGLDAAPGLWAEMFSLGLRLILAALFDGIIACWLLATLAVCVRRQTPAMPRRQAAPDDSQPRTVERHSAQSRLLPRRRRPMRSCTGGPRPADVDPLDLLR